MRDISAIDFGPLQEGVRLQDLQDAYSLHMAKGANHAEAMYFSQFQNIATYPSQRRILDIIKRDGKFYYNPQDGFGMVGVAMLAFERTCLVTLGKDQDGRHFAKLPWA